MSMLRPFPVMTGPALLLALVLTLLVPTPSAAQTPAAPFWQLTYLKAKPGKRADLAAFIEANWFAMDRRAKAAGDLEDYVLLEGTPADSSWDLLEIITYRDSLQLARVDSLYATVYHPQHVTVPINGQTFRELGTIVQSVTTRRRGVSW